MQYGAAIAQLVGMNRVRYAPEIGGSYFHQSSVCSVSLLVIHGLKGVLETIRDWRVGSCRPCSESHGVHCVGLGPLVVAIDVVVVCVFVASLWV